MSFTKVDSGSIPDTSTIAGCDPAGLGNICRYEGLVGIRCKEDKMTKKKTREELIEDVLFNNVFKAFEANDQELGFKFLYALKMWRKNDQSCAVK